MAVRIDSTTDSDEAVLAATGSKQPSESQPEKSATDVESDETTEVSDASKEETDDGDENSADVSEDENDEEDDSKDAKPKKKNGFKKRIDKLNRRVSEREQEVEYWKREAMRQNGTQEKVEAKAQPEIKLDATSSDGKPDINTFETHADYVEALTDWKIEQRELIKSYKEREDKAKAESQTQLQTFQAKVAEYKETVEDFEDVVNDVDHIPLSIAIQEAIITSEHGPQLMYELAKNKSELERINRLSAVAAAREIGRIEARLNTEEPKKIEKKQTKAPPPINPVGSKSTASVMKSPDDMNFQEFKKWRESQ